MKIIFDSNEATDCGTLVKVVGDVELSVTRSKFTRVETAFDLSELRSLVEQLGLPPSTDPGIVLEALAILRELKNEPEAMQENALKGSRLAGELLSIGSNLVTVLPFLLGIVS